MSLPSPTLAQILINIIKWDIMIMPIIGAISFVAAYIFLKFNSRYKIYKKQFIWIFVAMSIVSPPIGILATLKPLDKNHVVFSCVVLLVVLLFLFLESFIIRKFIKNNISIGKSFLFSILFNWPAWLLMLVLLILM